MSHGTLMSDTIISMYDTLVKVQELVIFVKILLFCLQSILNSSRIIWLMFCFSCKNLCFNQVDCKTKMCLLLIDLCYLHNKNCSKFTIIILTQSYYTVAVTGLFLNSSYRSLTGKINIFLLLLLLNNLLNVFCLTSSHHLIVL